MNGSGNPGYGLASVSPLPYTAPNRSRPTAWSATPAPTPHHRLSLDTDSLYVSGFVFGSGGNLEVIARIDWTDRCRPGSRTATATRTAVSPRATSSTPPAMRTTAATADGFPQTEPWTQHYGTAFTKAVTGTRPRTPGLLQPAGQPVARASEVVPPADNGTFTGQGQAGWKVTGNDDYVTTAASSRRGTESAQQGLVRYAKRAIAPNNVGPGRLGRVQPVVISLPRARSGSAWQANWDRDNEELTYRSSATTTSPPVFRTTICHRVEAGRRWASWTPAWSPARSTGTACSPRTRRATEVRSDTVTMCPPVTGSDSPYTSVLDAVRATMAPR